MESLCHDVGDVLADHGLVTFKELRRSWEQEFAIAIGFKEVAVQAWSPTLATLLVHGGLPFDVSGVALKEKKQKDNLPWLTKT